MDTLVLCHHIELHFEGFFGRLKERSCKKKLREFCITGKQDTQPIYRMSRCVIYSYPMGPETHSAQNNIDVPTPLKIAPLLIVCVSCV